MIDSPTIRVRSGAAAVLLMAVAVACGPAVADPTEGGQEASGDGPGLTSTSGASTSRTAGTTGVGGTTQAETTGADTAVESGDSPVADLPPPMCTAGDAVMLSAMLTPAGSYPATQGFSRWVACCPTQLTIILLLDGAAADPNATPRLVVSFDDDDLTGIHPAYAELFTPEGEFSADAEVDVITAVPFPEASDIAATVVIMAEGWDFQAEVTLPHCAELDIFCPC